MQHLAAHIGGVLACQEHVAGRDLVGLSRTFHGSIPTMLGHMFGIERGWNERRPNRPGRNRVDADALLDQRLGQRTRQSHDRTLGGSIIDQSLVAVVGSDRCGVDDGGALLHVAQRVFGHEEEAEDIGAEGRSICLASISRTSSVSCCSAALLTRISRRPNSLTVFSTASRQSFSSPMSPATLIARLPSCSIAATVSSASLCSSR